jgi:GT2 family glycosyltransferase
MSAGGIGFVVIGRNEGDRLRLCLNSILSQSNQVVYADSRSTDGSAQLAKSLSVTVTEVEGDPLTAARGRNAGFAALKCLWPQVELVQFVDGDCVIAPSWVSTAAMFLEKNEKAAVACGRRREAHPEASFYNGVIDREWDTPIGQADACGGDALVRVDAFEAVGGFRSELVAGEEPDFCARLRAAGWQVWRLDAPMTEHDAAIHNVGQWMRRAMRSGFGYAQVWNSTRLYAREMISALGWVVALPLIVLLIAIVIGDARVLWLFPPAYLFQIARIAALGGWTAYAWKYALLVMIAKVGEATGIFRYLFTARSTRAFEYKPVQPAQRPVA